MPGLIPFNRRNANLARVGSGFDDLYNMLDDFFSDSLMSTGRNLLKDTFKIDIEEREFDYVVEAELPGAKKDEITLNVENEELSISVNRMEETSDNGKNYLHRERRMSSMSRRVRLAGAKYEDITAKLDEGILTVTIPKDIKTGGARRIEIE